MSAAEEEQVTLLRAKALGYGVPEHMTEGLARYVVQGVMPGGFMRAVLEGDLFGALDRADDANMHALPAYARFLYNAAPRACFGTADRIDTWIKAALDATMDGSAG